MFGRASREPPIYYSRAMRSKVYTGRETLFWRDTWLRDKPTPTRKEISTVESYRRVQEYWDMTNGGWIWDQIEGALPFHIEETLHADMEDHDDIC